MTFLAIMSAVLLMLLGVGGVALLVAARKRRLSVPELLADWFQDATQ